MLTYTKMAIEILQSLLIELNRTSHIIPASWYLLNSLGINLYGFKQHVRNKIEYVHRGDLNIWLQFMTLMNTKGVSLKNIVCTYPAVKIYSDVC